MNVNDQQIYYQNSDGTIVDENGNAVDPGNSEDKEQFMDSLLSIPSEDVDQVKEMNKPKRKNWMRNRPCICKSGKKFKKCCWHKYR